MIIRDATLDDTLQIAQVHVSSWQTTYKGLMPDEAIAARPVTVREKQVKHVLSNPENDTMMLVAEVDSKVVGFASGGKPQYPNVVCDSELYAIYLVEEAQGQGIGKALVRAFAKKLQAAGFKSMMLWVLAKNTSSRGFYETLGGVRGGEGSYQVTKEITLKTVSYIWDDVQTLLIER